LLNAGLDWDVLLELAEEHSVLGALAIRLRDTSFQAVPARAREKLLNRLRAQHLFTLAMTADLFQVLKDFSGAGIETVLVKGPLVSLLAYGDPAVRSYVDLDLLVRHETILTATRRMTALGFEADVPESAIEAGKIPGEYLFRRPETRRIVELHTERTFRYYPRPMPIEALFARQRPVLLDGQPVPALSLEDELVLNCIHGAKHFWERLMWVADIAAIVTRHAEIDWAKTRTAARDIGAERMLRLGLELGAVILGMKLPEEMAAEVARDRAMPGLCSQVARWLPLAGYASPGLGERALFRMRMRGELLAGIAYLLRLSLSPTEEDWEEGAEERRSWLWDAARRPLRLIHKYGSRK
jgi:hypothetical protein